MKEQIIKELDNILNNILPENYNMKQYKEHMQEIKKAYSIYSEERSFTLKTVVIMEWTTAYKRKVNLLLLLGHITYDPNYVLTEEDQKLFKL